jgi:type IV pilus assembly protein PilV
MRITVRSSSRQRGVSIVEALVALVVLSVGLLGIASMFLESVRSNRTAVSRTMAVQLVNDMADRIRANRTGLGDYVLGRTDTPTAAVDCSAKECTPTQLAKWDLVQWYTSVRATLPKGADGAMPQVQVTYTAGVNSNDPGRYTVLAAWKDPGDASYLDTSVEVQNLRGAT